MDALILTLNIIKLVSLIALLIILIKHHNKLIERRNEIKEEIRAIERGEK